MQIQEFICFADENAIGFYAGNASFPEPFRDTKVGFLPKIGKNS